MRTGVKTLSFISIIIWASFASGNSDIICDGRSPEIIIDDRLYINDSPVMLKSVSYTTPQLSNKNKINIQLVRKDFSAIRKAGFNAVRTYEPLQPEVLDALEDAGLYVVQALVHLSDATNFDSDEEQREVIEEARKIILRDYCRSNIIMWSLWNDAPFNWGSSGGNAVERFGVSTVHNFFKKLRDAVKELDGSRPITAANVLNAKHAEIGMDLLDIIGVNVYFGIFDWPSQRYSQELANITAVQARQISEKHSKPLWIAETGISSIPGAHSPETVIPAQVRLIAREGFSGFSIFQWRDDPSKESDFNLTKVGVEGSWGLTTVNNVPKFDLSRIILALDETDKDTSKVSLDMRKSWRTFGDLSLFNHNTEPNIKIFDDFEFQNSKSLREAYQLRSKGNSRVYYGLQRDDDRWLNGLSLRYVPEDYGAWIILRRKYKYAIPFDHQDTLALDIKSFMGGWVNLVVTFKLTDGRTMRSPPLLLNNNATRFYGLKLSEFIISGDSRYFAGEIAEVSLRLNDVANFEQIDVPIEMLIKKMGLISENNFNLFIN